MPNSKASKWLLSVLLWVWVGAVYFFIEVAWKTAHGRPETISWTMLALAMLLAIPMERLGAELPWGMPLLAQSIMCAGGITAVEFVAGLILNVWLGLGIWDYTAMRFNILGQVCPQFFVVWIALSMCGIVMLDWMRYVIEGGERPHYKFI